VAPRVVDAFGAACHTLRAVINDEETVREALSNPELAEFEMHPVGVLDSGEVGFCWRVPVAQGHALWRQARSHAETLGRWPVLVLDPFYPDTFSRFYYAGDQDQSPAAVLSRASEMTPAAVWDVYRTTSVEDDHGAWDGYARSDLAESAARVGREPPLTLQDARQMYPDLGLLERALFEWEEQQRPTTAAEGGAYLDGQVELSDSCGLMLMPTAHSWEVPAYTDFYGASKPLGHEALVRVLQEWWERFGAELVGSWGTLLEFRVARPPTDVRTAYDLALQHAAVAPCTIVGPCVSVRHHARALLHRQQWVLHERP
jgi:uncharacterized protein DUF4253